MQSIELHGFVVSYLEPDGEPISTGEQSSDLFGNAWFEHIDVLVIPAARFDAAFFDLSTGCAGEILRKSVNYQIRLAIVGDVSGHQARSDAFDAFVWESNRGDYVWFLQDRAALDGKLAARAGVA